VAPEREPVAAFAGDSAPQTPALPGDLGRVRHRSPVATAARQDRLLEAWAARRAGNPHPGPLPEGEGV